MAEKLGKIEKPSSEKFEGKRKLLFVPLLYPDSEAPSEYVERFNAYWEQVAQQVRELQAKLGSISVAFHELDAAGGEDGLKSIQQINQKSSELVSECLAGGSRLEALEDMDTLSELMDWSRCLAVGLQSEKVFNTAYQSYQEVNRKRNEQLASKIDQSLGSAEMGILFMREGHQVQFPTDVQVFYVAPPALDEMKRWLRDHKAERGKDAEEETK